MTTITATYSPEDNKIRLYASSRLDAETYALVKGAGFAWAPKQELFVAPKWSPSREDLALKLAGEIEPEDMTLAERAQAKAARLDNLAHKRLSDCNAFQRAADSIAERFAFGQPILVGHHSERKARKDAERMQAAQGKAIKAHSSADYWLYRAEGVERHANFKNSARVRAGRIKTLLAELRDLQREINHAYIVLKFWGKVTEDAQISRAIGGDLATGPLASYSLYQDLRDGKVTPQEARAKSIAGAESVANSDYRRRYIEHTLARLGYERELLGPVDRYEGELTPVILQIFAREHGAHKPKGSKGDSDLFILESEVPMPLHLGDGCALELSADDWRDLMQSVGYEVPAKKDAGAPMLNFRREKITSASPWNRGQVDEFRQVEMTKAQYSAIDAESRGCRLSICGQFKFRTAPDPFHEGPRYMAARVAVFLTDSKAHEAPAAEDEAA